MLDGAGALTSYVGVLVAAAVESEVVYVVAAALALQGHLHSVGVVVAGATGAALGDQVTFWLLRGRLRSWLDRRASIARAGHVLTAAVLRHRVPLVFSIRFAPGLRIALTAACAYADVPLRIFVVVNTLASVVWAIGLYAALGWGHATAMQSLDVSGWWPVVLAAAVVVVASRSVSRALHAAALRAGSVAPVRRY